MDAIHTTNRKDNNMTAGGGESLLIQGLKWVGIIPLAIFLWKVIDSWFIVKNQTKQNSAAIEKLDKKFDDNAEQGKIRDEERRQDKLASDKKLNDVHDYIVGQVAIDKERNKNHNRRNND